VWFNLEDLDLDRQWSAPFHLASELPRRGRSRDPVPLAPSILWPFAESEVPARGFGHPAPIAYSLRLGGDIPAHTFEPAHEHRSPTVRNWLLHADSLAHTSTLYPKQHAIFCCPYAIIALDHWPCRWPMPQSATEVFAVELECRLGGFTIRLVSGPAYGVDPWREAEMHQLAEG